MVFTCQDYQGWQDQNHGPIQDKLKEAFNRAGALDLGFTISSYEKEPGAGVTGVYASLLNWARWRGEENAAPIPQAAIKFLKERLAEALPPEVSVNVRNCDIPMGP